MKIIFFDIDGTLIDKSFQMSESTREAITRARQNGHICMINTGRTYKMVGDYLSDWAEFDGCLCGCGTTVIYRGKELLHRTFSEQEAKRIIAGLEKYGIDAVLEGGQNNFQKPLSDMHTEKFRKYMAQFGSLGYGSFEEAPGKFDKFYCYVGEDEYRRGFFAEFADILDYIDRERGFYEIVPKGFSKASGMRYLAEYLGMSMEDTVAIGDSNNDIAMLQASHTAIAMGNSSREVLKLADYVTTDVDKDGIYNALTWLGVL